jgi:hypothetical protein
MLIKTSLDEIEAFVQKKARQRDEEASIEIEQHRSIHDTRKFYKRLNDVRTGNYLPAKTKCWRYRKNILKNTKAPIRRNQHVQSI